MDKRLPLMLWFTLILFGCTTTNNMVEMEYDKTILKSSEHFRVFTFAEIQVKYEKADSLVFNGWFWCDRYKIPTISKHTTKAP